MLNKKEQSILQHILGTYIEMYRAKDIFDNNYFKYTPEVVEEILNKCIENKESNGTKETQSTIRDSIISIKTEAEVRRFYEENLIYDYSNDNAKDECLKKVTLDELKYLYGIIYSSPIRSKVRKTELLELITKYFEGINRALSMKP